MNAEINRQALGNSRRAIRLTCPLRAERNEVRALRSGTVKRTVTDTTLPTGPIEREIIYHAPFTKCDRERDDAEVWTKLEERSVSKS